MNQRANSLYFQRYKKEETWGYIPLTARLRVGEKATKDRMGVAGENDEHRDDLRP
jgi:hypothetical protein